MTNDQIFEIQKTFGELATKVPLKLLRSYADIHSADHLHLFANYDNGFKEVGVHVIVRSRGEFDFQTCGFINRDGGGGSYQYIELNVEEPHRSPFNNTISIINLLKAYVDDEKFVAWLKQGGWGLTTEDVE